MSFLAPVIAGGGWDESMEGTYVVTRRAPATNDGRGRLVPGATSTFSIDASIQPISGRKLELLAEVARGRELRSVITASTIDPMTPDHAADQLAIAGEVWEVIEAAHWTDGGVPFTNAVIARLAKP